MSSVVEFLVLVLVSVVLGMFLNSMLASCLHICPCSRYRKRPLPDQQEGAAILEEF